MNSEYYYDPRDYGGYSFSEKTEYYYADSSGFELDYSESTSTSTYFTNGKSNSYTSATLSSYSYTSDPSSIYDYHQRRDVTSIENDGDGTTDITIYYLSTNTSPGSSSSHASASYNSSGVQTESSVGDSTQTFTSDGDTFEGEGSYASDFDGDGIIDYRNEYSYRDVRNSDGSFFSAESSSFYKSDYDADGVADYIIITNEQLTQSGGKAFELSWNVTNEFLDIEISKDLDGDFSYDSVRAFELNLGAPAALTSMGSHVASIEDTFMTPMPL